MRACCLPADGRPFEPRAADFPQELDPDFLVVWDGLDSPPWRSVKEADLRDFLLARAKEVCQIVASKASPDTAPMLPEGDQRPPQHRSRCCC